MKDHQEGKVLVLTGLDEKANFLFPAITNRKAEQVLVTSSVGVRISQPYGCIVRNILWAVYEENVEEIYIIGEKNSKKHTKKGKEILLKIQEAGVSEETIKTLEYINAAGIDLSEWLAETQEVKQVISENIALLKSHPLLPKTVSVYGFLANRKTGEFEAIDQ